MNSYWPVEREVCGTAGLFLGPGCLPRGRPISCYCTCISSNRFGDANASSLVVAAGPLLHPLLLLASLSELIIQ